MQNVILSKETNKKMSLCIIRPFIDTDFKSETCTTKTKIVIEYRTAIQKTNKQTYTHTQVLFYFRYLIQCIIDNDSVFNECTILPFKNYLQLNKFLS